MPELLGSLEEPPFSRTAVGVEKTNMARTCWGEKKAQQLRVNSNGRDVFELQLVSSPESLVLITNNYPGDKCCSYSAVNRLQFTAPSDSVVTGM